MKRIIATAALICALAGSSANATELLVNGGFETGDFTGWTVNANDTRVQKTGYDGEYPHSGTWFAALGDTSTAYPYGTLSQSVTDTAGQHLTLSFWLMSDGATPNYWDVNWDGSLVAGSVLTDVPDQRTTGYVHYVYRLVGTGADTLLSTSRTVPPTGPWTMSR